MKGADEILGFLAKAWSNNKKTKYRRGETFQCDPQEKTVYVPDYHGEYMKNLTGLPRWRVWRYTTFHEAMHLLLSPEDKYKFIYDLICEHGLHDKGDHSFINMIMSIIEDRRIEVQGIKEYKGYKTEREYVIELEKEANQRNRQEEGAQLEQEESVKALIRFMDALLTESDVKSDDQDERRFLVDVVEKARKVETVEQLEAATAYTTEKFYERYGELPQISEQQQNMMLGDHEYTDELVETSSGGAASGEIVREYENVEKERQILAQTKEEVEKMLKKAGMDQGGAGRLDPNQCTKTGDFYTLKEGTETIVNKLTSYLRNWRVGWEEVLDYYGDEVDVEEYLLGRKRDKQGKYFTTEKLLSQKTGVAIIVDMSGSIRAMRDDYMKAVTVIGEALNYVGTGFSVYIFTPPDYLIVKHKGEPWGTRCIAKLAGVEAGGGTPLADAVDITMELKPLEGFERIVIITDGRPNSHRRSVEAVKRAEARGVNVSILGIDKWHDTLEFSEFFSIVGYKTGKVKMINNIEDLPVTFFDLIRYN